MGEHHEIVGAAKGEPLPAGRTGARVRVPLDSAPSARWSRALAGHLATALTGHPAVGHLKLNDVVQGSELVLDGVEQSETELLGPVLLSAIAAADRVCADDAADPPRNMEPTEARALADAVSRSVTLD